MLPKHARLWARQDKAPHPLQVSLTKMSLRRHVVGARTGCVRVNILKVCCRISICKSLPHLPKP